MSNHKEMAPVIVVKALVYGIPVSLELVKGTEPVTLAMNEESRLAMRAEKYAGDDTIPEEIWLATSFPFHQIIRASYKIGEKDLAALVGSITIHEAMNK